MQKCYEKNKISFRKPKLSIYVTNEKSVREKKVGVKKVKKLKNCMRETQNVPMKISPKMAKNMFHGHFSFSREKKNTAVIIRGPP